MTAASKVKVSRTQAAIQRGMSSGNKAQPTHRTKILPPNILLFFIRQAGWPSASFSVKDLKFGKHLINLNNPVYSSPATKTASSMGKPIHPAIKRISNPDKLLTPSNRLTSSASKQPVKPLPTSDRLTHPRSNPPLLLKAPSVLSIKISNHKDTRSAMNAMVNTISKLDRFERCDPPLGNCSLSDGEAVCWVNGQSFVQIWDTTLELKAKDLHGLTKSIDEHFRAGRMDARKRMKDIQISGSTATSESQTQVHTYISVFNTFRNACLFINMPVIASEMFKDINHERCTFKIEETANDSIKNVTNRLRTDGVFVFLAEKMGLSEVLFRIKNWKDGSVRLVAVQVQVEDDAEPEEEGEDGQFKESEIIELCA